MDNIQNDDDDDDDERENISLASELEKEALDSFRRTMGHLDHSSFCWDGLPEFPDKNSLAPIDMSIPESQQMAARDHDGWDNLRERDRG